MSERMDLSAKFCPECGMKVESAEAVATGEDLTTNGSFSREDACLRIEGGQIRIYTHEDDEECDDNA